MAKTATKARPKLGPGFAIRRVTRETRARPDEPRGARARAGNERRVVPRIGDTGRVGDAEPRQVFFARPGTVQK